MYAQCQLKPNCGLVWIVPVKSKCTGLLASEAQCVAKRGKGIRVTNSLFKPKFQTSSSQHQPYRARIHFRRRRRSKWPQTYPNSLSSIHSVTHTLSHTHAYARTRTRPRARTQSQANFYKLLTISQNRAKQNKNPRLNKLKLNGVEEESNPDMLGLWFLRLKFTWW